MIIGIDTKKSKDFLSALKLLSGMFQEVILSIDAVGVSIQALDPANICAVAMQYKKEGFADYQVSVKEDLKISLKELTTITKKIKDGIIYLNYSPSMNLYISCVGKTEKKFDLSIYDDEEIKPLPKMDAEKYITVSTEDVIEALDATSYMEESEVRMEAKEKLRIFSEKNGRKAEVSIEFSGSMQTGISIYSRDYVEKMFSSDINDKVKIGFKQDYPLIVLYETKFMELKYGIAPRVED